LEKVWSLCESGELFFIDYLVDNCNSGYIFMESADGRNPGLLTKLKKYGLEELIPFVHKGQLLLMWWTLFQLINKFKDAILPIVDESGIA